MLEHTEWTKPHPQPPWRIMEVDILDRVQIYTPAANPDLKRDEWTDSYIQFAAEIEDDPQYLMVYSDRSLTEERGRR